MDIRCIVTGQNESGKSVIMRKTPNRKVDNGCRADSWCTLMHPDFREISQYKGV
jgi:hypothetical protein